MQRDTTEIIAELVILDRLGYVKSNLERIDYQIAEMLFRANSTNPTSLKKQSEKPIEKPDEKTPKKKRSRIKPKRTPKVYVYHKFDYED